MKNIITKLFLQALLLLCFIVLNTCTKLEKEMLVTTGDVTNVLTNTAEASGLIIDLGDGATQHGHCYGPTPNVMTTSSKTQLGVPAGTGGFTSQLANLISGTKYYIKAYISNGTATVYGEETSFTTVPASVPVLTTTEISSITKTTANSGGNITTDGGAPVTAYGVCWNTSPSPTNGNNITNDGTGTGNFTSGLSGLTPGTTYYVRAYATNSAGTTYGNELSFTTLSLPSTLPTLTTVTPSTITSVGATSGGNITDSGGAEVIARGVCWSITSNPVVTDSHTSNATGTGTFTSILAGLTANTLYYVRAYATNNAGTAYGNEISFTSTIKLTDFDGNTYNTVKIGTQLWMKENLNVIHYRNGDPIPEVSDGSTWNTLISGAYCYYSNDFGNVSINGRIYNYYTTVDNRNLCPTGWHVPTSAEWTLLRTYLGGESVAGGKLKETGTTNWINPNTNATNESGFTALPGGLREINGLFNDIGKNGFWWSATEWDATNAFLCQTLYDMPDALWYFNNKNLGLSVRCLQGEGKVLPAVTTTPVTGISSFVAISGGNAVSDGGTEITSRGVCWSTSTNPTIVNSKTTDGTGTGTFISSITGLSLGVTYYVRAYATNSTGTAYGNEISFTTTLAIGDSYQGGIVSYILKSGDPGYLSGQTRGLIAAPNDQSTGAEWGCLGTQILDAQGTAFGNGTKNTTAIVAGCSTAGIAAKLCSDLVLGGYSDWYLPSKDELNKLYINKAAVGGFVSVNYWSSSDFGNNYSYFQNFSDGTQGNNVKSNLYYVRAVRFFPAAPILPAVSTAPASSIASTSVISGGEILSGGGEIILSSGVCWSTSANPVATTSHTSDGAVTGTYISSITGLTPNTLYYVRAYATNIAGTNYGSEQIFKTAPVEIGASYQGGIMAYVLQPGDPGYVAGQTHGLIAAPSDQSTGSEWGCNGSLITGADGTAIGTGNQNTIDIMYSCATAGIAARICGDLVLNGYSDWYLPSKDELNKLYLNRVAIGGFVTNYYYWSSTEASNNTAWIRAFLDGYQRDEPKNSPDYVRAIRSF